MVYPRDNLLESGGFDPHWTYIGNTQIAIFSFFVERGYNLQKLQNIAKEVSRYNRDDLHFPHEIIRTVCDFPYKIIEKCFQ